MQNINLPDPNLRLALLDEVFTWRTDAYNWWEPMEQEYAAYRESAGGPAWKELTRKLSTGADELPELERFLLTLPLTADDLAALQDLVLDGGRAVYQLRPHWWSSGDHFVIANLTGLEYCTALTELDLGQGMFQSCSLTPLTGPTRLKHLRMSAADRHRDLDVLLTLPNLTSLEVANVAHAEDDRDTWHSIIAELQARGVSIAT
jgi:hypothetical protein